MIRCCEYLKKLQEILFIESATDPHGRISGGLLFAKRLFVADLSVYSERGMFNSIKFSALKK